MVDNKNMKEQITYIDSSIWEATVTFDLVAMIEHIGLSTQGYYCFLHFKTTKVVQDG